MIIQEIDGVEIWMSGNEVPKGQLRGSCWGRGCLCVCECVVRIYNFTTNILNTLVVIRDRVIQTSWVFYSVCSPSGSLWPGVHFYKFLCVCVCGFGNWRSDRTIAPLSRCQIVKFTTFLLSIVLRVWEGQRTHVFSQEKKIFLRKVWLNELLTERC